MPTLKLADMCSPSPTKHWGPPNADSTATDRKLGLMNFRGKKERSNARAEQTAILSRSPNLHK